MSPIKSPLYRINVPFAVHKRPYLRRVLNGIEAYARQRGGWRLSLPYYFPATPLFELGSRRSGSGMDGQISGVPARAQLDKLRANAVPTVLLNCAPPVPDWAGNVGLDFASTANLAVEHFVRLGFTNLAFFGSTRPNRSEHHRYRDAVCDAADAAGLQLAVFDRPPPAEDWADFASRQKQWRDWLQELPAGCGVICADDEQAARIYLAAEVAGRMIGEDLFVLGAGNEEAFCEAATPPLSSIQLDYFTMGWEAAVMLDQLMATGEVPKESKRIAFASIIVRQSSQPETHQDARVEQALGIIRSEIGSGLTVETLAKRLHIDRRHLHRLFMQQLGRSPMAEIQQARLEMAKRMLCESTEQLSTIAAYCGFSDQAHMARAVKKATGQTPGQFRLTGRRG